MKTWNDMQRFWRRAQMPATLVLIAANVLTWLLLVFAGSHVPVALLAFSSAYFPLPALWSAITWPLVGGGDPFSLLFGCMWAYTFGGSLERSWGTRTFVLFFVAVNALLALCVWVGALVLHSGASLSGLWCAVAAPTVAWCIVNRRESVSFFVMSIPAQFVAYLAMVLLWWHVGPPFLGLFALPVCGAAWWYAEKGRYSSKGYASSSASSPFAGGFRSPFNNGGAGQKTTQRPTAASRESVGGNNGFNALRWWKRRQENRKLEAMFRRSGYTDDDTKK